MSKAGVHHGQSPSKVTDQKDGEYREKLIPTEKAVNVRAEKNEVYKLNSIAYTGLYRLITGIQEEYGDTSQKKNTTEDEIVLGEIICLHHVLIGGMNRILR